MDSVFLTYESAKFRQLLRIIYLMKTDNEYYF